MDDIQSWWEVPSIAHFCSLFRAAFNLLDFDIEELEEALLTDGAEDSGSSLLQELMVRLLAGCVPSAKGYISIFNYQMFLRRLFRQKCQEYGRDNPFNTDMDFQFLPLRSKVEILHALCDFRLDADDVQDLLKNLESDSLRVEPLGHDESNSAYWYFYGTRLYREDFPKAKKGTQDRKRKVRDDKRKRTRRKKKKGAAAVEEEEDEEELGSNGENEDGCLKSRTGAGVRWQVVCFSEGDWEALTDRLHGSTSPPERALHRTLAEDFLPEIPRLFAEKERLQRKRIQESQPRRTSGRIEKLRRQQQREAAMLEEEERNIGRGNTMSRINEDSITDVDLERTMGSGGEDEEEDESKEQEKKMLVEEERERLFLCQLAKEEKITRAYLRSLSALSDERINIGPIVKEESSSESSAEEVFENRRRKSPRVKRRDKHKGRGRGSSGGNKSEGSKDGLPVGRQTNNSLSSATGPIIIQPSRRKLKSSQVRFRQSDEDLQTGLHKILERVKSHEDAWPFADPVDEEWAPRYYAVVRKPMHLRRMEEKLESGDYMSFSQFKTDFMLIVDNCRKYNGSDNEYTEMVENLLEVFQRAADRYLESDLSSDEDVAVEFPPPAGAVPGSLPGAEGGAVGGEESPPLSRVKKEKQDDVIKQEEEVPVKEEVSEGRRRRKRPRGGNSWKESENKRHHVEEESLNEEEDAKVEEKVTIKEEKKEDRREEKRRQDKKKEDKKEERKEEKKKKEEERKREEEAAEREKEKEKRGRADKENKNKIEDAEGKEIGEKEKAKADEKKEEEEERFGTHRKRRKKQTDEDGNDKKRKGQSGRERSRRGVEVEEEVLEEKKSSHENAPLTEEEEEEGNTSGSRKKDSSTSSKKSKNKPKKQAVVRNAAAIDALAEATEQTLKDINKWLDDTPRFSEFSSASNSPTHLLSAEEYDAVGKGIESEYRRSLRMCDSSLGELQQKEHGKKEAGQLGDKKGVRLDKKKSGQNTGGAGAVAAPKRTIIERLQPGKSKGNLLKQGRSNSDGDTSVSAGGAVGVKSVADEPSKKLGEATPKLSLGSVLRGDIAFGEVPKKESDEGGEEDEEEKVLQVGSIIIKEKKQEEKKVEVEEKVKEEKVNKAKMGSATPNLSAWFKAFGAPKGQGQRKKEPEQGKPTSLPEEVEKLNKPDEIKPPVTEEVRKPLSEEDAGVTGKIDSEPLSPSPSGTPHSNSGRQRHVSTGSSNVSDLSSAFSPDVVDPALSPRLVELPSHSPSAAIPPPLPSTFSPVNGTIRVGFYQDTSQKSGGSVGSSGGAEEGLPSPTHAGSSLPLPQPSVPIQSSDMQFYDTSKPLTDQYREVAARVHHHQHPPTALTPPPTSPSPPPPSVSPPRLPLPYPTTTPSVIFSAGSARVTSSPTYPPHILYPPPPVLTTSASYAPPVTTTASSFTASESGAATTFPVKKRLYTNVAVSSATNTPPTECTSVLVSPTCSSPLGRSYHSPEPQVALVQRTAPMVIQGSPPPYECSSQGSVPGYPHAHLQAPQSKLGFQRLPIYHHHPDLSHIHPQHPEKPEPLRTIIHHPSHSHPPHSPHPSDVQPNSPPRPVEPVPPYPVEHQRQVLDLTGSSTSSTSSNIQQESAPSPRTKAKTSRKTKAARQQQQRLVEQQASESRVGPVTSSGFQQFNKKSPELMVTGLQQSQHPPSSAFDFSPSLALYGRDDNDFQRRYIQTSPLPPPATGYYVDPGSMVKSPPPSPHQQPQPQHSQPLPQGCPPQVTVGSTLPSYPFQISPHYPHYHHPHHHRHLEAVPPAKAQYLSSSPPVPSSTASPTSAPSPSPTTSASPISAPSIPASLLSSAPPSFHPSNLSSLPPPLPAHRTFCTSGNNRPSGPGILAFQQGQQREGGSIVSGGAPFAVDPTHANPLYQQYHPHAHAHHLHPPHHIPQEELLLRGPAPPLAPAYPSGYQHAFDAISRPPWL